jgi:WD40 repeat protein
VENWKELRRFKGHAFYVVCVALSPDGKRAISAGSHDHTARLWDVESGKEIHRLDHKEAVWAVAFSPDGKRVLTGCGGIQRGAEFQPGSDNSMRLWEAGTGKLLGVFEGHRADVWCVAFSPDGKRALSGSGHWFHDSPDKSVRLWDVQSRKELQRFEEHTETIWNVAFLPDGKRAISCGDKTIRLWGLPAR